MRKHSINNNLNNKSPLIYCAVILLVMAGLLLSVFAGVACSAMVTVAWDPNPEPAVRGYNLHYGKSSGHYTNSVDVGSATSCTISALQEGVTYYLAVTAYDSSGNQSGYSDEITYSVPSGSDPAPSPGGNTSSGGGGGCFIATAAFGSPMAPEVVLLRGFRDSWLLTNSPGRLFVEFYYWISPPIADFISRDENLRQITRIILWPLIYGVKNITATIALIFLPLILWVLRREEWKPRLVAVRRKVLSGRGASTYRKTTVS